MDTIWPMILAVLTGNLLTAVFLYGFVQALKIPSGSPARSSILLCMFIPLLVLAGGFYIYG
jgi:hypothetical protein